MNAPILGLVALMAIPGMPLRALGATSDPAAPPAADTPPTQGSSPSPPVPSTTGPLPPAPSTRASLPPARSTPPAAAPPPEPVVVVPPTPAGSSVTRGKVALVAAGIAVAAAGGATVFGILALHNKNEYDKLPTYSNSDQGNNDAAYTDGCIALAVAAGVTSLVLYFTRDTQPVADPAASTAKKRSAGVSVSPWLAPPTAHGGGAGVLLRF